MALGIGLAAATGFRVFLPLLIAALAARFGHLPLNDTFGWLATAPALFTLGSAAVLETLAYYIPGVDHALDVIASPVAVVAAGTSPAPGHDRCAACRDVARRDIAGGGIAGLIRAARPSCARNRRRSPAGSRTR